MYMSTCNGLSSNTWLKFLQTKKWVIEMFFEDDWWILNCEHRSVGLLPLNGPPVDQCFGWGLLRPRLESFGLGLQSLSEFPSLWTSSWPVWCEDFCFCWGGVCKSVFMFASMFVCCTSAEVNSANTHTNTVSLINTYMHTYMAGSVATQRQTNSNNNNNRPPV